MPDHDPYPIIINRVSEDDLRLVDEHAHSFGKQPVSTYHPTNVEASAVPATNQVLGVRFLREVQDPHHVIVEQYALSLESAQELSVLLARAVLEALGQKKEGTE